MPEQILQATQDVCEQLLPNWTVSVTWAEADAESVSVTLSHPASHGIVFAFKPEDEKAIPAQVQRWVTALRSELDRFEAAPPLTNQTLVLGLQTLTKYFSWTSRQLDIVASVLLDAEVFSEAEVAWLAGYIAEDAPYQPVCKFGKNCPNHG